MWRKKRNVSAQQTRRATIVIVLGAAVSPFIFSGYSFLLQLVATVAFMLGLAIVATAVGWIEFGWERKRTVESDE